MSALRVICDAVRNQTLRNKFIFVCRRCALLRTMSTGDASNKTDDDKTSGSDSEYTSDSDGYYSDSSDEQSVHQPLYPGHIPTSPLQKLLLSVGAAGVAINAPWRADMISTLGETTGYFAIKSMRRKMLSDPVGRQILQEKPRINSNTVNFDHLRTLPQHTLGGAYVNWLDVNDADPDLRDPVTFVDDPELAYVMQRYREVHDLVHCVLGMPTHMLGEVSVKWVEAMHTQLPMCALAALFGPVRLGPKHRSLYLNTHLWWAIRNGLNATNMMCVYYEKHWETSLEELRQQLNLEEPPPTPGLRARQK